MFLSVGVTTNIHPIARLLLHNKLQRWYKAITSMHMEILWCCCWCCFICCCCCWVQDASCLLLEHHYAAEPQNTAQQARHICTAAKTLWELHESVQANTTDSADTACDAAACGPGATDGSSLSSETLGSLSVLVKVRFCSLCGLCPAWIGVCASSFKLQGR